ncbi:RibD family protein [Enterococcus sp. 669A]|uniref:RibD family protein n=1 Tax=Candidatus Enterococcus moelleringii TaxID=2815325 RepID=A0ABS3LDN3_9ENTE|nr:RibD family protein [Enterococcus sp. 669A]MBO1307158.1 RibD family protein [Enterococcus sp. 669A]
MKRPYIICHILSSLDGKINGNFMKAPLTEKYLKQYAAIRTDFQADAWAYGSRTVKEFLNNRKLKLSQPMSVVPAGDFVAKTNAQQYFVAIDTEGEIPWTEGTYKKAGRPNAHVIEIVTEGTPKEYLSHLRAIGVSYVIAGQECLDCQLAMEKLDQLFGIEKLLVCGGGRINWTFLQQGCIDELSLVVVPITDGSTESVTIFEQSPHWPSEDMVGFTLKNHQIIEENGFWLTYQVNNAK